MRVSEAGERQRVAGEALRRVFAWERLGEVSAPTARSEQAGPSGSRLEPGRLKHPAWRSPQHRNVGAGGAATDGQRPGPKWFEAREGPVAVAGFLEGRRALGQDEPRRFARRGLPPQAEARSSTPAHRSSRSSGKASILAPERWSGPIDFNGPAGLHSLIVHRGSAPERPHLDHAQEARRLPRQPNVVARARTMRPPFSDDTGLKEAAYRIFGTC